MHQEHTAMKVCTDACLFGAWLSQDDNLLKAKSIIDIGTGTGLLSLMVAQATDNSKMEDANPLKDQLFSPANITAIEIEKNAAVEASENFKASHWSERIELVHDSIQNFTAQSISNSNKKFDCIVSNPPFFEGDLKSPNTPKNIASHSIALPWSELIAQVVNLLDEKSFYYVLIPALRAYTMQKMGEINGLKLIEEVVVFNASKQKPFRVFQKFAKTEKPVAQIKRSNFIIKDAENNYTPEFTNLLKPFYLHL